MDQTSLATQVGIGWEVVGIVAGTLITLLLSGIGVLSGLIYKRQVETDKALTIQIEVANADHKRDVDKIYNAIEQQTERVANRFTDLCHERQASCGKQVDLKISGVCRKVESVKERLRDHMMNTA